MHREVVGPHFGWQVKHFNLLWIAGARCNAAGFRLPCMAGAAWCTLTQFCVAGARLGAHGLSVAWQVSHVDIAAAAASLPSHATEFFL